MRSRIRRTTALALVIFATLGTTACVSLPEKGPVVPIQDQVRTQPDVGVERRALPPQEGDPAQVIVTGFLQAMTAYPVRTDVARQFLASDTRDSWDPSKIVIYGNRDSVRGTDEVKVDIHSARWVDDRGVWRGKRGPGDVELRFPMTKEDGEYRIAKPPDAFIVPDDWFQDHYQPASVYYLDPTARILVPEPIFVPASQLAPALVKALLDGPGPQLHDVVRSFVPDGLTLGLSVPISDDGVATIDLQGDAGPLPPDAAKLMVYQFAWTLRQDPRVTGFTLTIGGQPVTLEGGGTLLSVDLGSEYAPYDIQASSLLFGLRDGLLESGDADSLTAVDGPLGQTKYGVERVAVSLKAGLAATVSDAGTALDLTSVNDDSHPFQQVLSGASRLLQPSWDFADRLWLVDRRADGALVSLIDTARDETVAVPVPVRGITGTRVKDILVSRDGSRLVAVVQGKRGDSLRESRIRYDSQGRLVAVTPSRNLPWSDDSQRIRDIGWRSTTSVAVLNQLTPNYAQVVPVPVDGSTISERRLAQQASAISVVASPVPGEPLFTRTAEGLLDPTGAEGDTKPLSLSVTSILYAG